MNFKMVKDASLKENIELLNFKKKYLKYILKYATYKKNNHPITLNDFVYCNEIIEIIENVTTDIKPENIKLDILYEDQYILIIDKPYNVSLAPTYAHPNNTLANAIIFYFQTIGLRQTVHYVTRLDLKTSGVVLVAKSKYIKDCLQEQRYNIKRRYLACVESELIGSAVIDKPISKSNDGIKRIICNEGKSAISHYRALKFENNMTLVEVMLKTGRTHQIRVHLASIGHGIINDDLYGTVVDDGVMQLNCYENCFIHPIFNHEICVKSRYARDLEVKLNK